MTGATNHRGQTALGTGARGLLSGTVSNGATWYEDVEITEDGTAVTDAENWEWRMQFRRSYDDGAELTLTTTDGTLTISQGSDSTVLQIRVAYSALTNMEGDYLADLASKDGSSRVIHWLHGTVSFIKEPVGF